MNHVSLKLDAALKAYIVANYQGSGEELQGEAIYLGKTPTDQTARSRIIINAGAEGGPHADDGNYEIPVQFTLITSLEKPAGTETETSLRQQHGEHVEAIKGIFSRSRVGTVKAALMALDAELGVSAYWQEAGSEEFNEMELRTTLVRVFEAYLV